MCEFCTQHGEGEKWYLNARNYSTELLNELQRRKFISHFYYQSIEKGNRSLSLLERIFRHQIVMPRFMRERQLGQSKIHHFGQEKYWISPPPSYGSIAAAVGQPKKRKAAPVTDSVLDRLTGMICWIWIFLDRRMCRKLNH